MLSVLSSHQHLLALVLQGVRMLFWLVVLVAVFGPLEHFFSVKPAKLFSKGWLTNVGWYFVNGLLPALLLGPPPR